MNELRYMYTLHVVYLVSKYARIMLSEIHILLKIKLEWINYILIDYKVISSNFLL